MKEETNGRILEARREPRRSADPIENTTQPADALASTGRSI